MKLILDKDFRRKLENNLADSLLYLTLKQLDPHDPKDIIGDALKEPLHIKLGDQIIIPIKEQLENIHI